jgi:hypothetical protein
VNKYERPDEHLVEILKRATKSKKRAKLGGGIMALAFSDPVARKKEEAGFNKILWR